MCRRPRYALLDWLAFSPAAEEGAESGEEQTQKAQTAARKDKQRDAKDFTAPKKVPDLAHSSIPRVVTI